MFRDSMIEPYKVCKGDYETAKRLILSKECYTNEYIATESGISKSKVSSLRIKIRRNCNG
jgi:hypothetical protein